MRFTLIFYYKGHVSLDFQLQIPKESATTLQREMDENSNLSFCNQFQSLSADNSQVERAGAVPGAGTGPVGANQSVVVAGNSAGSGGASADSTGADSSDNSPAGARVRRKAKRPEHYNKISDDIRIAAINMIRSGKSQAEVSVDLKIKPPTLSRMWEKYSKTGQKEKTQRGGARFATKLNDDQKHQIESWVKEDCTLTLKEMKKRVDDDFGVKVSESTISRILLGFHFSIKRVSIQPAHRQPSRSAKSMPTCSQISCRCVKSSSLSTRVVSMSL